jgi:hypothetical protein
VILRVVPSFQFDWLQFITGVFDIEGVKIAINDSEPVVVRAVPYFEKLFNVLQKHRKRYFFISVMYTMYYGG